MKKVLLMVAILMFVAAPVFAQGGNDQSAGSVSLSGAALDSGRNGAINSTAEGSNYAYGMSQQINLSGTAGYVNTDPVTGATTIIGFSAFGGDVTPTIVLDTSLLNTASGSFSTAALNGRGEAGGIGAGWGVAGDWDDIADGDVDLPNWNDIGFGGRRR